jgi:hypothetical protein
MTEVCVWCGEELADDAAIRHSRVAYGVCPACSGEVARESGVPLESFLAGLALPVLLVDRHGRVQRANVEVHCSRPTPWTGPPGGTVGDVLGCANAREGDGCGGAQCSGCVIRSTIADTWRSGRPRSDVPGLLQVWREGVPEVRSFRLSTRRVGRLVLLGFTPELPAVMDDLPGELDAEADEGTGSDTLAASPPTEPEGGDEA